MTPPNTPSGLSEDGCGLGAGYIGVQAAGSGGLGAALAGVTAACGVGWYYAGRAIDRKTTLIKILPD